MNNRIAKLFLFCLALWVSAPVLAEPIWIDVRSVVEHQIDRIEGDVRISHDEIVPKLSKLVPDTDAEIHLYCRSGGRAGKAMAALQEAGYTNVSNAGGINDARRLRGLDGG